MFYFIFYFEFSFFLFIIFINYFLFLFYDFLSLSFNLLSFFISLLSPVHMSSSYWSLFGIQCYSFFGLIQYGQSERTTASPNPKMTVYK